MKKSHIFWLILGFVVQGIIALISLEGLYTIWLVGSFFTIIGALLGDIEDMDDKDFPFYWWFPVTWLLTGIGLVFYGIYQVVKKPMLYIGNKCQQFNNYLDK